MVLLAQPSFGSSLYLKNLFSENQRNFAERLKTFERLEELYLNFGQEYEDYTGKAVDGIDQVSRLVQVSRDTLTNFFFDGAFLININLADQDQGSIFIIFHNN